MNEYIHDSTDRNNNDVDFLRDISNASPNCPLCPQFLEQQHQIFHNSLALIHLLIETGFQNFPNLQKQFRLAQAQLIEEIRTSNSEFEQEIVKETVRLFFGKLKQQLKRIKSPPSLLKLKLSL